MTRKDVIAVACKIMGLIFIATMIFPLLSMLLTMFSPFSDFWREMGRFAFAIVGVAVVSVPLLAASDFIARIVCGKRADMPVQINLNRSELLQVAVIVLGIYFAATAVPNIVVQTFRMGRGLATEGSAFDWTSSWVGHNIARFIIGIVLVIIARPRAAINAALDTAKRLRMAGRESCCCNDEEGKD